MSNCNCTADEAQKLISKTVGIVSVCITALWFSAAILAPSYGGCGDPNCTESHGDQIVLYFLCAHMLLSAVIFLIAMFHYAARPINVSDYEIKEYIENIQKRKRNRRIRGVIYVIAVIVLIIFLKNPPLSFAV